MDCKEEGNWKENYLGSIKGCRGFYYILQRINDLIND